MARAPPDHPCPPKTLHNGPMPGCYGGLQGACREGFQGHRPASQGLEEQELVPSCLTQHPPIRGTWVYSSTEFASDSR